MVDVAVTIFFITVILKHNPFLQRACHLVEKGRFIPVKRIISETIWSEDQMSDLGTGRGLQRKPLGRSVLWTISLPLQAPSNPDLQAGPRGLALWIYYLFAGVQYRLVCWVSETHRDRGLSLGYSSPSRNHLRPGEWQPHHEQSPSKQIWILNSKTNFQMHPRRAHGMDTCFTELTPLSFHWWQEAETQGSIMRTDRGILSGDNGKCKTAKP